MGTVEPIRDIKEIRNVENILRKKDLRDLLLFTIGTNSGLRISDILKLNIGDVKNKEYITLREQKTGKFKRFPINSKLKSMFENYIKDKPSDSPLFTTIFNNRLDRSNAYRIIKNACEQAGVSAKVGTHTLRKTFGYHHYKQYKDIALLQKIFNHAAPYVTLRYIGIEQDQIDESYKNFVL